MPHSNHLEAYSEPYYLPYSSFWRFSLLSAHLAYPGNKDPLRRNGMKKTQRYALGIEHYIVRLPHPITLRMLIKS